MLQDATVEQIESLWFPSSRFLILALLAWYFFVLGVDLCLRMFSNMETSSPKL
jgi:hypothetical protein